MNFNQIRILLTYFNILLMLLIICINSKLIEIKKMTKNLVEDS
jgi:hypothetical protein